MLKETRTEQGCFRGCLIFIGIGCLIGVVGGLILGINWMTKEYQMPGAVAGALGMFIGALAGALLGAIGGLIWGKIATKRQMREDEF